METTTRMPNRDTRKGVEEKRFENGNGHIDHHLYTDIANVAKERAGRAIEYTSGVVREKPLAMICAAAAIGLLTGFLMTRK